jgi:hypothetical protein
MLGLHGRLTSIRRRPVDAAFYAVATGAYVFFRAGSFTGIADRLSDTPGYERTAAAPIWSLRFLAGERGFTVPLVYKIVTGAHARIVVQLVISIVAWLFLAAVVALVVRRRWVRWLGFLLVLAFSLTTPIILWDTLLLSESLTFSLLAAFVAAWLLVLDAPSWPKAWLVLVIGLLWAFARDTNAYVVLFIGVVAAFTLLDARRRALKLALVAGCLAVFALATASADHGQRWVQPLADVLTYRVQTSHGLAAYLASHGISEFPQLPNPAGQPARTRYLDYLAEHPIYTLVRPFSGRQAAPATSPSDAKSLLDPQLTAYNDNANQRFAPLPHQLRNVLYPQGVTRVLVVLLVVLVAAVLVALFAGGVRPVWLVPVTALLAVYPHGVVTWHLSGIEVDRHALTGAILLRLGTLLLLVLTLDAATLPERARVPARRAVHT